MGGVLGTLMEIGLTISEQYLLIYYLDKNFYRKYQNKYIYIMILLGNTILVDMINKIQLISIAPIIICILLYELIGYKVYKTGKMNLLIHILLYLSLLLTLDMIVLGVSTYISPDSVLLNKIMGNDYRLFLGAISKGLLFFTIKSLPQKREQVIEMGKMWYILSVSSVFNIGVTFYITDVIYSTNTNKQIAIIGILWSICLLLINICNYFIYIYIAKYNQKQKDYLLIKTVNEMQYNQIMSNEKYVCEIKKIKHDLSNQMIALVTLLENQQVNKALQYIQDINKCMVSRNEYYITGHSVIDGIINQKYEICKKNNIHFIVKANQLEYIQINARDLCVALGNLLDNAIEANLKLEKRNRLIELDLHLKNGYFVIEIQNNYNKNLIKSNLETTKDEKWHGIGIKSIKDCVEKYEGDLYIEPRQSVFFAKVVLLNTCGNQISQISS